MAPREGGIPSQRLKTPASSGRIPVGILIGPASRKERIAATVVRDRRENNDRAIRVLIQAHRNDHVMTGPDGCGHVAARGRKGRYENGWYRGVDETAPLLGRCHNQPRKREIAFRWSRARRKKRRGGKG